MPVRYYLRCKRPSASSFYWPKIKELVHEVSKCDDDLERVSWTLAADWLSGCR